MAPEPATAHRAEYSRLWMGDGNDKPSSQHELRRLFDERGVQRSRPDGTVRPTAESADATALPLSAQQEASPGQVPTKTPTPFTRGMLVSPSQLLNHCKSSKSVRGKTLDSPFAVVITLLAAFSTAFSAIFLVIGLSGPSYGRHIGKHGGLSPSIAAFLTTLIAKLIELSFATISVAFVGQVLARRAVEQQKESGAGITLAEMNMRTWIMQPGTLFTQWQSTRYAGRSMLGMVSVVAAIMTLLYTSAATALVQPQPMMLWTPRQLQTLVKASFANVVYITEGCKTPISSDYDREFSDTKPDTSQASCFQLTSGSGALYNLGSFLSTWRDRVASGAPVDPNDRPAGAALLYDNTTVQAAWVESVNVTQRDFPGYIINNITLAMPHPGIVQAAQDAGNRLPPASDPDIQLEIRASLPSPILNVICVTMNTTQLRPFVYTLWEDRNKTSCDESDWETIRVNESWPRCASYPPNLDLYLNGTEFDDIFQWGYNHGRHRYPPVFPTLPGDYNTIFNDTTGMSVGWGSTSVYLLGKGGPTDPLGWPTNRGRDDMNYVMCGISAGITPFCSTRYNITTGGAALQAVCDDEDAHQYIKSAGGAVPRGNETLSTDFVSIASEWARGISIGHGLTKRNVTLDRLLTQLIVTSGDLNRALPSTAEALAVLGANMLIESSMDAPTVMFWNYSNPTIDGSYQYFNASVRMQQYKSGGTQPYEEAFAIVLIVVFAMCVLILAYFLFHRYWYTDFSEPTHLFTLALQSPSSDKIAGSCATGPIGEQYNIRWQVDTDDGHYYVTPQDDTVTDHGSDVKKRRGWKEDVELLLRK